LYGLVLLSGSGVIGPADRPSDRFVSGVHASEAIGRLKGGDTPGMLRDLDRATTAYCRAITRARDDVAKSHVSDYEWHRGQVLDGIARADVGNLRDVNDRCSAVPDAVRSVMTLFGDFDAVLMGRGLAHRRGADPTRPRNTGLPFAAYSTT
jgi:hypothetical protein